jgi:hypothetical protein
MEHTASKAEVCRALPIDVLKMTEKTATHTGSAATSFSVADDGKVTPPVEVTGGSPAANKGVY